MLEIGADACNICAQLVLIECDVNRQIQAVLPDSIDFLKIFDQPIATPGAVCAIDRAFEIEADADIDIVW